jgi:hypothetical protein
MKVHIVIKGTKEGSGIRKVLMDHEQEMSEADADTIVQDLWHMLGGNVVEE